MGTVKVKSEGGYAFLLFRTNEGPLRVLEQGKTHIVKGVSVVVCTYQIDNRKTDKNTPTNRNQQNCPDGQASKQRTKKKARMGTNKKGDLACTVGLEEPIEQKLHSNSAVTSKFLGQKSNVNQRSYHLTDQEVFSQAQAGYREVRRQTQPLPRNFDESEDFDIDQYEREQYDSFSEMINKTTEALIEEGFQRDRSECRICSSAKEFLDLDFFKEFTETETSSKPSFNFASTKLPSYGAITGSSSFVLNQDPSSGRISRTSTLQGRPVTTENKFLKQIEDEESAFLFMGLDEESQFLSSAQ